MIAKARHFVPTHELLSIYHSTFSANLIYGCQIWGQHTNSFLKKIETLQNNAMRIMSFSDHRASPGLIYKSFKILKLKDQITLSKTTYFYMTKSTRNYLWVLTTILPQLMHSIQLSHVTPKKENYLSHKLTQHDMVDTQLSTPP